jgi:WD40 repeat protein
MKNRNAVVLLLFIFSIAGNGIAQDAPKPQVVKKNSFQKKGQNTLCMALSPDGTTLAIGGDDNKIAVLNAADGTEQLTLIGSEGWITAIRFSNDGKLLAVGDRTGSVKVYDINTGSIATTFEGHKGTVYAVDFNGRYNYVASVGADGQLKLWDLATRQISKKIKVCEKEALATRFSPDGSKVLTAGADGLVKEWDVLSGNMVRAIEAHADMYIRAAAYSPDGNYIATGADDNDVKVWSTANGRLIKQFNQNHKKWVQTIDFAADNNHIVTGGHDNKVVLWNLELGKRVAIVEQEGSFVSGTLFSPDLKALYTTGYQAKSIAWNLEQLNLTPKPSVVASAENSSDDANRAGAGSKKASANIFELIQPRIKAGEKFVCLEDEIKIRGLVNFEIGVREIALVNKQSGQREKLKLSDGMFEHTTKLGFLDNEITLEAIDTKGNKLEKKFTVYRIFDKTNPSELAKLSRSGNDYALIIATNTYQAMSPLVNPVFDANTIAAKLEADYNFQVEKLIDPPLSQITLKIREYAKKIYAEDDQLFIFIAGHGEFDDFYKEGYLVASDSKKGDEGKTSYLPHSALRTYINNIPCKHIFLAMDVCFGGTFDPHIASARGESETDMAARAHFIKRKLNSKTRLYLTSGGKEYVPDGRPGQHSPFARKFLEALSSYGGADRILTYKEILSLIESVVPEPRYGEFGDNQPGSDFIFIGK